MIQAVGRLREALHGTLPGTGRRAWLGVDIGTHAVKLARVARRGRNWNVVLSRLVPAAPPTGLSHSTIADGQLGELLRRHVPRVVVSGGKSAGCVVSASMLRMQTCEVPPGSKSESRQMVSYELDPGNESKAPQFDFFENRVSRPGEEGMQTLTVLSLPHSTASHVAEDLWSNGIWCQTLDTMPSALARAVGLVDRQAAHETVIALDWGATSPTLTLISEGLPVFTRSFRECGLATAIEQAREQFGLSSEDVWQLLSNVAAQGSDPHALQNAKRLLTRLFEGTFMEFLEEVLKTQSYLASQAYKLRPSRIWLFGGGALIPGVIEGLRDATGLDVRRWGLPSTNRSESNALHALYGPAIAMSAWGAVR